jgi:hypothetical protein
VSWSSNESGPTAANNCFSIKSKIVTLACEVEGGDGNTAWQHAQLFRRSTASNNANDQLLKGLKVSFEVVQQNQL